MTAAFFNFSASRTPPLPSFMDKFIELNRGCRANSSIKKEHKWGSRWWEWPLMMRSVLYWTGKERRTSHLLYYHCSHLLHWQPGGLVARSRPAICR